MSMSMKIVSPAIRAQRRSLRVEHVSSLNAAAAASDSPRCPNSPALSVASMASIGSSEDAGSVSDCRFFQADDDGATPISLRSILADDGLAEAFARFLDRECCSENLLFYRAVHSLRDASQTICLDDIVDIYERFVAPAAPMQVNVSGACSAAIVRDLAALRSISASMSSLNSCSTENLSSSTSSISTECSSTTSSITTSSITTSGSAAAAGGQEQPNESVCNSIEVKTRLMEQIYDRALREVTELLCLDKLSRFIQSDICADACGSPAETEPVATLSQSVSLSSAVPSSDASSASSRSVRASVRHAAAKVFHRLTPHRPSSSKRLSTEQ